MDTKKSRPEEREAGKRPFAPETIPVENLKRIHSLHARPSDLGFAWDSEQEMDRALLRGAQAYLVGGDLKLSC
jgi:hypothetical protein